MKYGKMVRSKIQYKNQSIIRSGIKTGQKRLAVLLSAGFILSGAFSFVPAKAEAAEDTFVVKGEALVCFKSDANAASEAAVAREAEHTLEADVRVDEADPLLLVADPETSLESGAENDPDGAQVSWNETSDGPSDSVGMITLVQSETLTTDQLVEELQRREDVLYAEPNYSYDAASDDYTSLQWEHTTTYGVHDEGWNTFTDQKPSPKVDTSGIVVAIVDTGVDCSHEDLKNVMWSEGENYPTLKTMGGGKYGYNGVHFMENGNEYDSSDPRDEVGHGTHCAGIVAAEWNDFGTSGIASGVRIMAVKVANEVGRFKTDNIVRGYRYILAAKKAGVNIVATNNSYGATNSSFSEMLVLRAATDAGIVNAFAADNSGADMNVEDATSSKRGTIPGNIVVGCSNEKGEISEFSNYGSRDVNVFAQGENIWSTLPMGTGPATAGSPVLEMGGVRYDMDFSDKTDISADLLQIRDDKVTKSIETTLIGGEEKHVLRLTRKAAEGEELVFQTKEFPNLRDCLGGVLRVYVPYDGHIDIKVKEIDQNGGERSIYSSDQPLKKGMNDVGFAYEEAMVDGQKENVSLQFTLKIQNSETGAMSSYADLSMIRLCSQAANYGPLSGTSMATPIVTGAIATLAAQYPGDSPEKLVARVTGSVQPMDAMKDKCISGGIFRLDKALAGDTVPVPTSAKVAGDEFTLEGFFFGTEQGTLTVGGAACTVKEWSDTRIVAALPEGFEAGEKLVEVTSGKGTGHRLLRMGTQANLYPRLPLPGATISDDGEYEIPDEAAREYEDFYGGEFGGMTGLNGYLYTLHGIPDVGTSAYRYDISQKTWERVCTADTYLPTGAVTTWNGKVLFVATHEEKQETVLGLLDPDTKKITWHLYSSEAYENGVRMVNNGYGIYLIGGEYGNADSGAFGNAMFLHVRQVDPVKMKVSELEWESVANCNISLGYDETGKIYLCDSYQLENPNGVAISTISVDGKKSSLRSVDDKSIFPDAAAKTHLSAVAVYTKQGFLLTGLPEFDASEAVISDTYLISPDAKSAAKQSNLVSYRLMFRLMGTGYRNNAYFLGATNAEKRQLVFTGIPVETYDTYGEKAYSEEWVKGIRYGKDGFRSKAHPSAAAWKKTSKGYTYVDAGGWSPKSQWQKIDGKWYYFDQDGIMEKDAYRKGYYLTTSGAWDGKAKAAGWKQNDTGWWYSLDGKSFLKNCWKKIDGKWYCFKADGYAAQSEFVGGWWCDKNCVQSDPVKYGWHKTAKGWWYGTAGGWYAKSASYVIDGKKYHFDANGYCTNP